MDKHECKWEECPDELRELCTFHRLGMISKALVEAGIPPDAVTVVALRSLADITVKQMAAVQLQAQAKNN